MTKNAATVPIAATAAPMAAKAVQPGQLQPDQDHMSIGNAAANILGWPFRRRIAPSGSTYSGIYGRLETDGVGLAAAFPELGTGASNITITATPASKTARIWADWAPTNARPLSVF